MSDITDICRMPLASNPFPLSPLRRISRTGALAQTGRGPSGVRVVAEMGRGWSGGRGVADRYSATESGLGVAKSARFGDVEDGAWEEKVVVVADVMVGETSEPFSFYLPRPFDGFDGVLKAHARAVAEWFYDGG